MLRVVPITPFFCCMPWHGRQEDDHGGACCYCDRAIAVPEFARDKVVACIYCGLDRQIIPEKEIEP